jgi:hypothetical protein
MFQKNLTFLFSLKDHFQYHLLSFVEIPKLFSSLDYLERVKYTSNSLENVLHNLISLAIQLTPPDLLAMFL